MTEEKYKKIRGKKEKSTRERVKSLKRRRRKRTERVDLD